MPTRKLKDDVVGANSLALVTTCPAIACNGNDVYSDVQPRSNQIHATVKLLDTTAALDLFVLESKNSIVDLKERMDVKENRMTVRMCDRLLSSVERLDKIVLGALRKDVIPNLGAKGNTQYVLGRLRSA